MNKELLMFYGRECPYSRAMLEELNENGFPEGVKIVRKETWHHPENVEIRKAYVDVLKEAALEKDGNPRDTIVPSFVDPETRDAIANPSYDELIKWVVERNG